MSEKKSKNVLYLTKHAFIIRKLSKQCFAQPPFQPYLAHRYAVIGVNYC